MDNRAVPVTGTLIWYVAICPRQAWLMGHAIEPYHDHELLALGRLLAETAYPRERKELALPGMKVDVIRHRPQYQDEWSDEDEALVIGEVKRSPRAQHAQRLQLGYYLLRLREAGLTVRGELRYPEQRRIEPVELTPELEQAVRQAMAQVEELLQRPDPPPPVRIPACAKCAYFEFCWIDEEPSGTPATTPRRGRSRTSKSSKTPPQPSINPTDPPSVSPSTRSGADTPPRLATSAKDDHLISPPQPPSHPSP